MSAKRLKKKNILVTTLLVAAILPTALSCSAPESPQVAADDQSPTATGTTAAGTIGAGETGRRATQNLAPNTLLISNVRLRTIPPVNAAQWVGDLQLASDKPIEMAVEFDFSPLNDAGGPDLSFGPTKLPVGRHIAAQIGIDIHRPERIEAEKEPSLSVLVAQKGLDGPQQLGCKMPNRKPPADQELTYLTINIPDKPVALPARIPLMVALVDSSSAIAADSQGPISTEELESLSRESSWLMVAYLLLSDEKKPPEAAAVPQNTPIE